MKFKVGDRVEHSLYGNGTVIGFGKFDGLPLVEFEKTDSRFHDGLGNEIHDVRGKDGHCWFTSDIKPLNNQTIVIYSKGLKTIALLKEGHKVIKQASAKCNPSDTYDFNIGARLAFSRLVGGIYIGGVDMAIDTIREVKSFDWEGFKKGKFAVHCDTEEKAREFLKECDEQGIKWCTNTKISDQKETRWDIYKNNTSYGCDFFGGLMFGTFDNIPKIDYTPSNTIREVKRPAKVGEWIKIIDGAGSELSKVGDLARVTRVWYDNDGVDYITDYGVKTGGFHKRYVVLENYQPEETIRPSLSMYTDKELIDELAKRLEDKQ